MEIEVKQTGTVFFVRLPGGSKAYLRYKVEENIMQLIETYTPPEYRGRGLAKMMMDKAVQYAVEKGLKVLPICSYALHYFIKNVDKRRLLVDEYRNMGDDKLVEQYNRRLEYEKRKQAEM